MCSAVINPVSNGFDPTKQVEVLTGHHLYTAANILDSIL